MKQRAVAIGALPTGLVRPGEVFDWPTKASWAVEISDEEAAVAQEAEAAKAAAQARQEQQSTSGARVIPGKSEPTQPTSGRRRRGPFVAET